jgi:DNA-binding XRE family transcriptional regulator
MTSTAENKIRSIRLKLNISRRDLAQKVLASPQQLLRIEMGEEKPRYDLALKISNALGQKLAKVFPGTAKLPFDEGDFESASNNSEALEKAG